MLTQGWDDILRDQLRRESVGVVGVKLVYPDGTLQHAGIVLGANRRTEHEGVGAAPTAQGSCGRWHLRRRAAAVTGAFLACRRTDFQALGGFDEIELPILFNDIDFCLRMRQQGLQILFEPAIIARHHELKTLRLAYSEETRAHYTVHALCVMRQRWGDAFRRDPGFNPHFSRWGRPFETLSEPSMDVILDHLFCSARANPWLVRRLNKIPAGLKSSKSSVKALRKVPPPVDRRPKLALTESRCRQMEFLMQHREDELGGDRGLRDRTSGVLRA